MNKLILTLLTSIFCLNVFGIFFKDNLDFNLIFKPESVIDSTSCVNLNEEDTLTCLSKVITSGNSTGNDFFLLGQMYLLGIGTVVDRAKGIQLLERGSIEFHNDDAMVLLGDLALNQDLLTAKYWYARAAKISNGEGQLKLANIYRYGEEKDQDPESAFKLYKEASNQGILRAQYELALMYAMGIGVAADLTRSLFMLEALCDKKHNDSCILYEKIKVLQQS